MRKPVILIAGWDEIQCQDLKRMLGPGFEVSLAPDRPGALGAFQSCCPDLVVIGSSRGDIQDGLDSAKQIRRKDKDVPVILIVKYSSEARVVAALRAGINDYFKVPFSCEEFVASIKRNLMFSHRKLPTFDFSDVSIDQPVIGASQPMQEIKAHISKIAATDSTVLITGETGTGKEMTAELIHRNSPRRRKPFVCVNCAALPETLLESELFGYERGAFTGAVALKRGKFELAGGGSVFLDEIGDMSPYAQVKILRAVEKKEVDRLGGKESIPLDLRFIAATHRDPERLVSEGKFREDLYYRLNVARVHMPSLRHRKEDVLPLIEQEIQELNRRFGRDVQGFTEEALEALLHYRWPGNVRELKNLLEATFVNLPPRRIAFMDLPKLFRKKLKETEGRSKSERDRVLSALFATKWNKSKAAQKLQWSRMTLYRKMTKYHITKSPKP